MTADRDQLMAAFQRSLSRLNWIAHHQMSKYVGQLGLTSAQYMALRTIVLLGPDVAIGEVGEALQAPPSSMTSIIDRLAGHGLIEREPHPGDRRSVVVRATPAGQKLVQTIDAEGRAMLLGIMDQFSEDEIISFTRLFDRLQAAFGEAEFPQIDRLVESEMRQGAAEDRRNGTSSATASLTD